jgi:hypothetical protein
MASLQLGNDPDPSTIPRSSLLGSLRPPDPYAVTVSNLTIAAPLPACTIPRAVPITVPKAVQRRMMKGKDAAVPKELVRGVNLQVGAGEVLAM